MPPLPWMILRATACAFDRCVWAVHFYDLIDGSSAVGIQPIYRNGHLHAINADWVKAANVNGV
jgi:hypothetical protein